MWKEFKGRLCRLSALVVGDQKGLLSDAVLAQDLNAQAQQHFEEGRLEKAQVLMERAVQILIRSLGEEHPDTQAARQTLAAYCVEGENTKSP